MVSEADRLNAIERVRHSIGANSGGAPLRKRSIHRGLKRKDIHISYAYEMELLHSFVLNKLVRDIYGVNSSNGEMCDCTVTQSKENS